MFRGLQKNPYLYILLGYLSVIVVGTGLLMLPASTHEGIKLIDALYMATSAVCVTGLVVLDLARDFTYLGQGVILTLIQIGGIGITVFSSFILLATMRSFSLLDQSIVEESMTFDREVKVRRLVIYVVSIVLVCEFIGAAFLTYFFSQEFPFNEALYKGIFTSISAFCNAGFGLFSNSLENYPTHVGINFVVMVLIFTGGIGYFCIMDLFMNIRNKGLKLRKFKFTVHTRVVFFVSITLVLVGALLFFLLEYRGMSETYSVTQSMMISLFQSVSGRTAGFSTYDFSIVSPATLFIFMALMFIGGSPSSCGGGIKTTTFWVLIKWFTSSVKNRERVFVLGRSVPKQAVKKAVMLGILAISWLFLVLFLASIFEGKGITAGAFSFEDLMFEMFSALGTTGLSTGISDQLTSPTKLLVTLTMYFGRTGLLTLVSFFAFSIREERFSYPEEDIFVG